MPRATVKTEAEHFDLKTLEEGFVELKRMSYGAWLTRQELMVEQQMTGSTKETAQVSAKMMQRRVAEHEFRNCLVAHNLEDEHGNPLDVNSASFLDVLDPKVGQEIGTYIDELHKVDEGN
jgi:hypothetical protein